MSWLALAFVLTPFAPASSPRSLAEQTKWAYQVVGALIRGTPVPESDASEPAQGVFVTVEVGGQVVACRGSLSPTQPTLDREIMRQAKYAAQFDPRYGRVQLRGKPFRVTLTVVEGLTSIATVDGLRPEDGLVLRKGSQVGVVLPFEGRDAQTRLQWAYRKAHVPVGSKASLQRLTAVRHRYPE